MASDTQKFSLGSAAQGATIALILVKIDAVHQSTLTWWQVFAPIWAPVAIILTAAALSWVAREVL